MDERYPRSDRQHSAAARGERHRSRGPHQGPAASTGRLPAFHRARIHSDRSHHGHTGLRTGRAVRIDAGRSAGRDGDFPLSAQLQGNHHPKHRRPAVSRRHLRSDVPPRLQSQQPFADGTHDFDGFRGRRRHRHDRKRRPVHRSRGTPHSRRHSRVPNKSPLPSCPSPSRSSPC